jgi:hypothetical protein
MIWVRQAHESQRDDLQEGLELAALVVMLSTSLRGLPRGRLAGAMLTRQDEAAKTQIVQYVYTKMKQLCLQVRRRRCSTKAGHRKFFEEGG